MTFKERYNQVYGFIKEYYEDNHIYPSYSDMEDGTGIQSGNLELIINQLVKDKKLGRKAGASRGFWLVKLPISAPIETNP